VVFGGLVMVSKDGRNWQIGTTREVDWIVNGTTEGPSITVAIPPVFEAYATFYEPDGVAILAHEQAVVNRLVEFTPGQSWWLGYLDTGAHSIVSDDAPKVSLDWDWRYVLMAAAPSKPSAGERDTCERSTASFRTCSLLKIDPGWFRLSGTTPGPVLAGQKLLSKLFTTIRWFKPTRPAGCRCQTTRTRPRLRGRRNRILGSFSATATLDQPRCRNHSFAHYLLRADLAPPADEGVLPAVP
jgi:hypothetical protein